MIGRSSKRQLRSVVLLIAGNLHAALGFSNEAIAQRLDTPRQIISKWRKRYFEEGFGGPEERSRAGRPARFSPQSRDRDQGPGV